MNPLLIPLLVLSAMQLLWALWVRHERRLGRVWREKFVECEHLLCQSERQRSQLARLVRDHVAGSAQVQGSTRDRSLLEKWAPMPLEQPEQAAALGMIEPSSDQTPAGSPQQSPPLDDAEQARLVRAAALLALRDKGPEMLRALQHLPDQARAE